MFSTAELLTPEFKQFERIVRKKGRECTKCGGTHYNAVYKFCDNCRAAAAAWTAERRADHRSDGRRHKLCWYCTEKDDRETITCAYHREYQRVYKEKVRHDQAKKGLCGWSRCQKPRDAGVYCEEHRQRVTDNYHARMGSQSRAA